MDESLARAIWDRFYRLDSLVVESKDTWLAGMNSRTEGSGHLFQHIIDNMGGYFLLQRSVLHEDVVFVEDLKEEGNQTLSFQKALDPVLAPLAPMVIFRRMWPEKPGSRGWRHDWSSFPLAD